MLCESSASCQEPLSDFIILVSFSNVGVSVISGLSADRPCARSVKVDCPCPMAQMAARGSVVWALSEQRGVFYREGLSSYCAEGEQWKYDTVRYVCHRSCLKTGESHQRMQ